MANHQYLFASVYVGLLVIVFIGMAGTFINMSMGEASVCSVGEKSGEKIFSVLPPVVMAVMVLSLGFYLPPGLRAVLVDAARVIGGG